MYKVEEVKANKDDVVVFYFDEDSYSCDQVFNLFKKISELFPNNKVLGLPSNTKILFQKKEKIIKLLQDTLQLLLNTEEKK